MREPTLLLQNTNGISPLGIKAGPTLIEPAQDYDYSNRQSEIKDGFGHG